MSDRCDKCEFRQVADWFYRCVKCGYGVSVKRGGQSDPE
jgi:hypothetical protein